jgi:glycosyltransferase involved in cell wall biosynthesis
MSGLPAASGAGGGRLRVLQLIDGLRPGVGVPETLRLMVEPCRARGVDFAVASLHREAGDLGDELARGGVAVHDLDFRFWREARRLWSLRGVVARERTLVVHANEARAIELALKLGRFVPKLRVLGHLRVTGNVRSGSGRRERWLADHAGELFEMVAVSKAVLADYHAATGVKGGRVILNGRPLARFGGDLDAGERRRRRALLGVPDDALLLLCAATLQPSKDHPTLLRAAARLRVQGLPFRLLLAGDGPDAGLLAALARGLALDDEVRFLGRRDDVAALMQVADLYVATSVREGLPGSVIEAQASGLACVVTRCGGPEEVVVDGASGRIVPVGDDTAVAHAIGELATDPGKRARMGEAARDNARRFDLERMVDEWCALYRQAIGSPGGAPFSAPPTPAPRCD